VASRWGLHSEGCLRAGDEFCLPDDLKTRDLLIYETFSCPRCVASPANCYLAEIRSFGNRVWGICAYTPED